jgi:hypothetical protein
VALAFCLFSNGALADVSAGTVKNPKQIERVSKRLAARSIPRWRSITINFPWRSCRVSFKSVKQFPLAISGVACGTRFACFLRRAPRYSCFY